MAAESPMPRPVKPTADEDDTHSVDGEEVDLKVRNSSFFCIRIGVTVSRIFGRHSVKSVLLSWWTWLFLCVPLAYNIKNKYCTLSLVQNIR